MLILLESVLIRLESVLILLESVLIRLESVLTDADDEQSGVAKEAAVGSYIQVSILGECVLIILECVLIILECVLILVPPKHKAWTADRKHECRNTKLKPFI